MPRYHYTAIAPSGKKAKGTVSAESPYAARKQLRARNIHPTTVEPVSTGGEGRSFFGNIGRGGKKSELIDFTKQMATLLNSGIKLTEAITVLTMQVSDVRLRNALNDIRDRVITGESFSDAVAEYSDIFDIIYISMIRVGEVTGTLGSSFATIAKFMEKRRNVESKVITAMMYPIVLSIACLGAIIFLTTMVIPKIATQIASTGQELPWITKQMLVIGHILTSGWILVVIGSIAAVIYGIRRYLRTERGAMIRDKFLLWLPMFGPLIKQRVVSRFTSTLSTLLSSGLSMAESLRVVSEVTGNMPLKQAVLAARERILSGADIATPLRESGVIDPALAHMVTVGEKSGELEKMLKNISEDLEASTDVVIERLGVLLEPVLVVFMAGVVAVIAVATILPILNVSGGLLE